MVKKIAMFCVLALSPVLMYSQQTDTLSSGEFEFTLEQCLQYAFDNSYSRKVNLLNEESSEAVYQQSRNNRYPSVNASANETMSHTGTASDVNFSGNVGVNASVTLYQGGNIKNTIKQNRLQAEETKIRSAQYDDNLKIEILNEYLTALSCMERQKYQLGILESSKQQLERGKRMFDLGAMVESDYLMLEAQYENDKTDSLNTVISLENSLLNLKKYLSMSADAKLTIVEPDTALIYQMALLPSEQEVVSAAKQHMPDMQLALSAIETADIAMEISKAGRRPTISASAGISTGHNNFDDFSLQLKDRLSQQIGVSVSYPIWDRGSAKLQIKKAEIQQKQAELDLKQTELEVTRTVVNQYRATALEYQKYLAYQKRKDAYAASFEVYKKKFNVGSIIAVDLLERQNNYISVLNDYINAKYGFMLKRKILDVYTGESAGM
ncbi:MAG: TolC family protein [Bacteroidales bacterium]|nr:TolC family protein [Bacteroidales bacterium]